MGDVAVRSGSGGVMPGTAVLGTSIVDRLVVPADLVRTKAHNAAGDRIWRVYLEAWTWAGGEEGSGVATRTSRVEITNDATVPPTAGGAPAVRDRRARRLEPQGMDEVGSVVLREVSRTYRESELAPTPASDAVRYFYVLEDSRGTPDTAGTNQARRYFVLGDPPPYQDIDGEDSDNAWVITLRRAQGPT